MPPALVTATRRRSRDIGPRSNRRNRHSRAILTAARRNDSLWNSVCRNSGPQRIKVSHAFGRFTPSGPCTAVRDAGAQLSSFAHIPGFGGSRHRADGVGLGTGKGNVIVQIGKRRQVDLMYQHSGCRFGNAHLGPSRHLVRRSCLVANGGKADIARRS
jgi:hypothetical protein